MDFGRITDPQAWKQAMAGLLRRGGEVGEYIEQAPQKAGQAIIEAGQRQQALMNEAFDPTGKTLIRNPQAANEAGMNLLAGPLGFAPAGITAWHGSPHTFDKFDMSKVGTGEGAQAYGHGMYFAENPNIAKSYQDSTTVKFKGAQAKELPESAWDEIGTVMQKHNIAGDMVAGVDEPKMVRMMLNKYADKLAPQEKQVFEKYASAPEGNLYKVDIPDQHIPMMLDWDKPLLDQTPQVQEALAKLGIKSDKQKLKEFDDALLESLFSDSAKSLPKQPINPTGESIYQTIIEGNPKYTAEKLKEAGITGIRYLDQGSRAKGGTSNFVVFDPTDVKILERNNQPLSRKELIQEQLDKLSK